VAVSAQPIETKLAARVASIGDDDVEASLDEARAAESFLARRGSTVLEMRHERLRRAVVEGLSSERRCALNAKLAEAFEQAGERARPETVAIHHHAAGNVEHARDHARRAADAALSAGAF